MVRVDTQGSHFAAFGREYLRHTKGRWARSPVELESWQQEFVDEALALDKNGRRIYQEALLGIPRKNGKSTLASAFGLYFLVADGEDGPEVYTCAGKREQARIVFGQASEMVKASGPLRDFVIPQRAALLCPDNNGVFRALASDGDLEHGLNPSAAVVDELHAHKNSKLYTAITTGSGARDQPFTLTITTAGFDFDSTLGQLYTRAMALPEIEKRGDFLTIARDRENGFLAWWYGPREGVAVDLDDPEVWKACNPASWITPEYLRKQRNKPSMIASEFQRYHLNRWTEAEDSWLEAEAWDSLYDTSAEIPKGAPVWLAVDASTQFDTTCVLKLYRRPDGRVVPKAHVWARRQKDPSAPRLPAHKVTTRRISHADVRQHVVKISKTNPVIGLIYDPQLFVESAEILSDEFGIDTVSFAQHSALTAPASVHLYEAIHDGRIAHDGDQVLRAHVLAGATKPAGESWRLTKNKTRRPIDALICLMMGVGKALEAESSGGFEW